MERFEKYGFFSSIVSICEGKPWEYRKLLAVPAETYYLTRCVEIEQDDYRKEYSELVNGKVK